MSLSSAVSALATRIGQEFKTLRAEVAAALGGKASTTHAATHASGGADQVTPAAIGAASSGHSHPPAAPAAHAASHTPGSSDPLTGYLPSTAAGAASGVATLDAGGKIPQAQLPAIALTDFLGAVASQAAMLALTGQRGDWCTRTDLGVDYQLIAEPASTLASWRAMTYPASPVSSVNGRTGPVTGLAEAADVTTALAGKETAGAAASSMSAHLGSADPHTQYREHNEAPRASSIAANANVDCGVAGDVQLSVTGGAPVLTPTNGQNGRTVVIECLASGGARTVTLAATVVLTTGVTSLALNVPSGKVGVFVVRYSSLGTGVFELASAYLRS